MSDISKLVAELESSVDDFIDGLSPIEKKIFNSVIVILKELSVDKSGNIRNNLKNIKILGKVRKEMNRIIFNKKYLNDVYSFTESFNKVADIQNAYFSTIATSFTPPALAEAIKKEAIAATIEGLTEQGINGNVVTQLRDIIKTNVTSGGNYAEFTSTLKTFIEGDAETSGVLTRYARVYVTDSINEYSANHIKTITDDLGLEWFRYVGSLMATSRDWCKELVAQEYVHQSQFTALLKGKVNGKQVAIYEKTGLPEGMKAGTNVSNLQTLRGGWGCNHQLVPVLTESVPKKIRDKVAG